MTEARSQRDTIIGTAGHILVLGGPGSGKTHVALMKAGTRIQEKKLLPGQSVLFLSFARATVARLAEKAVELVGPKERKQLDLNTYHGFAWNILRSHGYLLQPKRSLRLLPPPEAASHLSIVPKADRDSEKERLFNDEGVLHFDLFARKTAQLLSRSERLRKIICSAYPVIVLDEFQDTNGDEWEMIRTFGAHSHLIALADADQRIYEFRGADPRRIGEFITTFAPAQFDFGNENHRSNGTDITQFGNDLLTGANRGKIYQNVKVSRYGFYSGYKTIYSLKTALIDAIKRCKKRDAPDWSIAILVPSKRLMLAVSTYLESAIDNMPSISHDVAMDTTGPALAGVLIAFLLEPPGTDTLHGLLKRLCRHIYGRRGDSPATGTERGLVDALGVFIDCGKLRGSRRVALVDAARKIVENRCSLSLTGDPGEDWLTVRRFFESAPVEELRCVAQEATYLRLLHKGASLRSRLNELWRKSGIYYGAEDAVRDALLQEHLSSPVKPVKGIYVMTVHKAKGKEFSEVMIYEDSYQRIVRTNATESEIAQARLTLRVGVTRAKFRTLILTPKDDACPLV